VRALVIVAALAACSPELRAPETPSPGPTPGTATEPDEEAREIDAGDGDAPIGLYAIDATGCTATGCHLWWQSLLRAPAPSDGQTSVIHRLSEGYGGPRRYFAGPRIDGTLARTIRDQAVQAACQDFVAGRIRGAALVGASRGAVIAVDAARRTQDEPGCRVGGQALPVVFIGAVDAVDTLVWFLDKRPPPGTPTFHRVKAQRWENVVTTVDIPGAAVSVAPETDEKGQKLDHIRVCFHPSSLSWLASAAIQHGLPVVGPFGVKPGGERRLRTGPCAPDAGGAGYCYPVARVRVASDGTACRAPIPEQELDGYSSSTCDEWTAGSCTRATVCLPFASLDQCEDRAPFSPLPASACGA
jgi:hypothetical protein